MAALSDPRDVSPDTHGAAHAADTAYASGAEREGRREAEPELSTMTDGSLGNDGRAAARVAGPLTPVTPRGEATRRRILDAAEAVFGEQGYYGASVAEITRRAGVAQGTFYIYFHSKREIFVELVEDMGHQLRRAMRSGMVGATNRLEIERGGFAAFFAFVAEHPRMYYIIEEARRVTPEAAEAYYRRIVDGYVRGLRAAMDAGEIRRTDAEAVAYALIGIGHFVALRWLIWPRRDGYARAAGSPSPTGRDDVAFTQVTQLPEGVLSAVIDLITHGLAPLPDAPASPADTGER